MMLRFMVQALQDPSLCSSTFQPSRGPVYLCTYICGQPEMRVKENVLNHSSSLKIRNWSRVTALRYNYSLHPLSPLPIDRYTGPMRVQPLFTFGKIDNIQGARVGGRTGFCGFLFRSILKHGKKLERWWADEGGLKRQGRWDAKGKNSPVKKSKLQ
jgi:hypothetical protein